MALSVAPGKRSILVVIIALLFVGVLGVETGSSCQIFAAWKPPSRTARAVRPSIRTPTPSPSITRFARGASGRRATACPAGQWIGFNYGNTDITAFYDGNAGNGPNGCEVRDDVVSFPTGAPASVPAALAVPSNLTVEAYASIYVAPGGILSFAPGDDLIMEGGFSMSAGAGAILNLSGTGPASGQAVTVQGATDVPGQWGMIDYQPGSQGEITYSVIKDGGGGGPDSEPSTLYTEVAVEQAAILIDHTQLIDSAGNGVEVLQDGRPILNDDSFTNSAASGANPSPRYPVQYDFVPGDLTGCLEGLTSSGYDGGDYVDIGKGRSGSVAATGSWPQAGIPYPVGVSVDFLAGSTLTIPAGVTLLMTRTHYLYVLSDATLNFSGVPSQPVDITSENDSPQSHTPPAPGDWGGIDYQDGSAGAIVYTTVKYGGGTMPAGHGELVVGDVSPAGLSVTDSSFLNSAADDVQVVNDGLPELNRDTFGVAPTGSYGVENSNYFFGTMVDATRDYWSDTGPGLGQGARVSTGVNDTPWYSYSSTGASTAALLEPFGAAGSFGVIGSVGTGAVSVDMLSANPEPVTPLGSPQAFLDARMWSGSSFSSVTVKDCDGTTGRILQYYNGSGWWPVANVSAPDAHGCMSVTLTGTTAPSLSDMMANGVVFVATLPGMTKTEVTSSATNNTSTYGDPIRLTAVVQAESGTPSGSVDFTIDGSVIGTAQTLAAGIARVNVTDEPAGSHSIVATYIPADDVKLLASSSPPLDEIIHKAPLVIKASNATGSYGGMLPRWRGPQTLWSETRRRLLRRSPHARPWHPPHRA